MQIKGSQRGFVTIATGAEKYYEMAYDLLQSYRLNGNCELPFAIICDRDCEIAHAFDDVVVIDNACYSYMDKLFLDEYAPYEETVFIDADILILQDVKVLWDELSSGDDFACYGRVLPLESREGWFYYEGMGKLQSRLEYNISMHGGVYYLRKTERCKEIFSCARALIADYAMYSFYYFKEPADEPLLALSMVLNQCKPRANQECIAVLPGNEKRISASEEGALLWDGKPSKALLIHFGNRNIPRWLYQYMLSGIKARLAGKSGKISLAARCGLCVRCLPAELKHMMRRILRKRFIAKG